MLCDDWSASVLLAMRARVRTRCVTLLNLTNQLDFSRQKTTLIASGDACAPVKALIIIVGNNRIGKQRFDGFGATVADEF